MDALEQIEQAKKKLEIIPESIRKIYSLEIDKGIFYIHNPFCVAFDIDENLTIVENGNVFEISSEKFCIRIWKEALITHTYIF